jgi:hypothetical protein
MGADARPNNKTTQAIANALALTFLDHHESIHFGNIAVDTTAMKQFLQVNEAIGFELAESIAMRCRTPDSTIDCLAKLRKTNTVALTTIAEQLMVLFTSEPGLKQVPYGQPIFEELSRALQEGGYVFGNGVLTSTQNDVAKVPETNALEGIYTAVIGPRPADKKADPFEALTNGYRIQKQATEGDSAQWHSALGAFRTAVELVMSSSALKVAAHRKETFKGAAIARQVREKLVDWDVLTAHEMASFEAFYKLASEEGAHAAASDAERDPERVQLARQLAPTLIQFLLNRVGKVVR